MSKNTIKNITPVSSKANNSVAANVQESKQGIQKDEHYEKEANSIAEQVVKSNDPPVDNNVLPKPVKPVVTPLVQKKKDDDDDDDEFTLNQNIQLKPLSFAKESSMEKGVSETTWLQRKIEGSQGGGEDISSDTREYMENRFQMDFSRVKVHNNTTADELSTRLQAKAFTTGNNIYFKKGNYNPHTKDGKQLLAHELTHVVQQNTELSPVIQRLPDGWVPPRAEIRANLTNVTFLPPESVTTLHLTYRQQGYAIILKTLIEDQYEEGLENRIPQIGAHWGRWSDPDLRPTDETETVIRSISIETPIMSELIEWLQSNNYRVSGISERELHIMRQGNSSVDLYSVLREYFPSWLTLFIFQRLMARHQSLLTEYREDMERANSTYETTVYANQSDRPDVYERTVSALSVSVDVLEAIRQDLIIGSLDTTSNFYRLIWREVDFGLPDTIRDEMLAARFLSFCYTQPEYARRASQEHAARIEIIRRFVNIAIPQASLREGEEVLFDSPSPYNVPPMAATITSYPPLLPLPGFSSTLPVSLAVRGANYDFSMDLVTRNISDSAAVVFRYDYQWQMAYLPLDTILSLENPEAIDQAEGETLEPSLGTEIIERMNRAARYREQDIETMEDELGIFSITTRPLVEINALLRSLGAVISSVWREINQPRHEETFVFSRPGLYFVSCLAGYQPEGDEAVVRVPSSAIYPYPVYVQDPERLASHYLYNSQSQVMSQHRRIDAIRERLGGSEDLSEEERSELQQELHELQILIGNDLGAEIVLRRDAIVRAVFEREKLRIEHLPEEQLTEQLNTRLQTIETALSSNNAYTEALVTLAGQIIEERSDASRDDRTYYRPLKQGLDRYSSILTVRGRRGLSNPLRLRAYFIGDEGATIPLNLEYVHNEEDNEYIISDLTTPDSEDTSIGDDETDEENTPAIVLGVVKLLREMSYGQRGYVAVEWNNHRYVKPVTASPGAIITEGIENVVSIAELALVAAAPFTGGASLAFLVPIGIVGAIPSAYRLIRRIENETYRLDLAMITDIVAILGAGVQVGAALRIVRIPGRIGRIVLGFGPNALQGIIITATLWEEIEQVSNDTNLSEGAKRARILAAFGSALYQLGMMVGQDAMDLAYERGAPRPADVDAPTHAPDAEPGLHAPDVETPAPVPDAEAGHPVPDVETPAPVPDAEAGQPAPDAETSGQAPEPSLHESIEETLARGQAAREHGHVSSEVRSLTIRLEGLLRQFESLRQRAIESNNPRLAEAIEDYIHQARDVHRELMDNQDNLDAQGTARDLIDTMTETRNHLRGQIEPQPDVEEGSPDEADPTPEQPQDIVPTTPVPEGGTSSAPEVTHQTPADLIGPDGFEGTHGARLNELYERYKDQDPHRVDVTPEEWAYRTRGEARGLLDSLLPEGWARRASRRRGSSEHGIVDVTVTREMVEDYPSDVTFETPIQVGDTLPLRQSSDRPSTSVLRRLFIDRLSVMSSDARAHFNEAVRRTIERYSMPELRERGLVFFDEDGQQRFWPADDLGNAWEVHHIIELRWGGTNAPDNLIAIPYREHNSISAWWRRWAERILQDPALQEAFDDPDAQGEHRPELPETLNFE